MFSCPLALKDSGTLYSMYRELHSKYWSFYTSQERRSHGILFFIREIGRIVNRAIYPSN